MLSRAKLYLLEESTDVVGRLIAIFPLATCRAIANKTRPLVQDDERERANEPRDFAIYVA